MNRKVRKTAGPLPVLPSSDIDFARIPGYWLLSPGKTSLNKHTLSLLIRPL